MSRFAIGALFLTFAANVHASALVREITCTAGKEIVKLTVVNSKADGFYVEGASLSLKGKPASLELDYADSLSDLKTSGDYGELGGKNLVLQDRAKERTIQLTLDKDIAVGEKSGAWVTFQEADETCPAPNTRQVRAKCVAE